MAFQFAVSPDFAADRIGQWFLFNTWLQRQIGANIHLGIPADFAELRSSLRSDRLDLLYANPFDLAVAVRELGFTPIAAPVARADEAAVVVRADSEIHSVKDLRTPPRVVCTDAPDVEFIGRILLEPSGLERSTITVRQRPSYVVVAKELLAGTADVGFFLRRSFDELSELTRANLRVIGTSHIYVVRHALLAGPRLAERRGDILSALLGMAESDKGRGLLDELGLVEGWKEMPPDEAEFLIDLMETLID